MPEGWRFQKLGDVLDVQNGFAFESEQFSDHEGVPLIRIRDLKDGRKTVLRYAGQYDERYLVNAGDLLIGMDGEFRCYKWRGERALLNQRVCRLVDFAEGIDPEFVALGVNSHLKQIEDATPYVTVKHLSAKSIKAIDFAFPDLAEQRRIVSRIKACMERVDEIEQNNDGRVRAAYPLIRSIRRALLGAPDCIPNGWTERRLDELAEVIYGISEAISANRDSSIGPPIVRMANISLNGHLDLSDLRYCEVPKGRESHFLLKKGDLLLNWRSGSASHVGKTAIFDAEGDFTCASFILRIRAMAGANNRYLRHVLNFMRAEGVFAGSSRMQINHKLNAAEFSAFPIRVPPTVAHQERIAQLLDDAERVSDRVSTEVASVDELTKNLRVSILHKAFAGEL